MRHIVAVADVRHLEAREILALVLTNRKQVGKCLTRMQEVAERVDNGDVRIASQLLNAFMPIGTDHDAVEIAREHTRRVLDRLATPKLQVTAAEKECLSAELVHPNLKRHTRPRRRFLKDHAERLPCKQFMRNPRLLLCLEISGERQNLLHIVRTQLMNGE